MKRFVVLFILCQICLHVYAYKPSYYVEAMRILMDSPVHYQFSFSADSTEIPHDSLMTYFQSPSDDKYAYVTPTKDSVLYNAKINYLMAEDYWKKQDFSHALDFYLKANSYDPDNVQIRAYIGQAYRLLGETKTSIKWLEKVVEDDPKYYFGHFFLANAYYEAGKLKKAKDEILYAHVMNRNDVFIKNSVIKILASLDEKLSDWSAYPDIYIKTNADTIVIKLHAKNLPWMTYASLKCLWLYEPGYAKLHGENEKDPNKLNYYMELDSYFMEFLAYNNAKKKNKDKAERIEMEVFEKTVKGKIFPAYIYYEKCLVDNPQLGKELTEKSIKNIVKYVKKYKIEKLD